MINGIAASDGIGIGYVLKVKEADLSFERKTGCVADDEKLRFTAAVEDFCKKTELQANRVRTEVGEEQAKIIEGHILMIKDPYMISEIEKKIELGLCAEASLSDICDMFVMIFSSADDELTRLRAADVRDIKNGVLCELLGAEETDLSNVKENTVIVALELTPSMTTSMSKNIVGIITESGGRTSHSAILARAMEIPAVLSAENAFSTLRDGEKVIVDGNHGKVINTPDLSTEKEYIIKREKFSVEREALSVFRGKPTVTGDGIKKQLFSNIGKAVDAAKVVDMDGEGVGLFRTEFLFMERDTAPSEDEQFEAYKKAVLSLGGRPLIIRTLDVGGDKDVPYMNLPKEENPFLGLRAVRYCLSEKDMYRAQLRALLRASAFGDIRVMIPLVTGIEELREVKQMIEEEKAELHSKGIAFKGNIKVGIMVETPAASIIAPLLAKEADFFSIGTNDLTQYTMAVDRGNDKVAYLYSPLSPSVLRSVKYIIESGKMAGIEVGMCGEAAADKRLIPLLIAFGLDEFSVSASSVLKVRSEIFKYSLDECKKIAEKVMGLSTEKEIADYLASVTEK